MTSHALKKDAQIMHYNTKEERHLQDHGGEGGVAADVASTENVGGGSGVGGLKGKRKMSCVWGEDTQ